MPRPVIGIATQTQEPLPGQAPLAWIMGQQYVRVLTAAGAVPWIIPLLADDEPTLRAIYDYLDGLFLTGGVDVDPQHYGEQTSDWCGRTDSARDRTELQLLRWAAADAKPVLGVCRGMQIINVAHGGSLYQDLGRQEADLKKHDYFPSPGGCTRATLIHDVRIAPASRLRGILGVDQLQVNSMHHQGVKQLAPGLTASAQSPDGLIEGIEGTGRQFLIGVQWHPEELTESQPEMARLFEALVAAAVGTV